MEPSLNDSFRYVFDSQPKQVLATAEKLAEISTKKGAAGRYKVYDQNTAEGQKEKYVASVDSAPVWILSNKERFARAVNAIVNRFIHLLSSKKTFLTDLQKKEYKDLDLAMSSFYKAASDIIVNKAITPEERVKLKENIEVINKKIMGINKNRKIFPFKEAEASYHTFMIKTNPRTSSRGK